MNSRKHRSIRGWLPKEPDLPTLQLENRPKKLFTKRNVLLIFVGMIIAMLLSGAVFFGFFMNLFSNPVEEAQNTVKTFINALNDYNAAAAWDLMSPRMQASYGSIQNFAGSYVTQLQQSGWNAQLLDVQNVGGSIAVYILIPFQDSYRIVADTRITQNNSSVTKTQTFDLKTYVFKNFQPSSWKIDNWSTSA
jgi:predicted PurR-regulated permease PerM